MQMEIELAEDAVFLGFDSSTQSLKATALSSSLEVIAYQSVQFDNDLPAYKTRDGVHRGQDAEVTAPPGMWAEALELVLQRLGDASFDFSKVAAVSGSGQQHGSVYWKKGSEVILKDLDPKIPLVEQLRHAFSTNKSPVWMDSSTRKQCQDIEEAVGGPQSLADKTGSRAYERFTASQIRKLYQTNREAYENTERISLVSSFQASLLIGTYASIDHTDGAGMNLMDLHSRTWSQESLEATAPALEAKLGPLAPAHAVAGKVHPFFVNKYGFNPDCLVIQWSGDNPNSLAGLALGKPGDLAISLGTSDTVFGVVLTPKPGLEGHVFPNPVDPQSYMTMLCYKNGSLTREDVRNRCAEGSWSKFNDLLNQRAPGNGGCLGFFYKDPEILPPMPAGTHRYTTAEAETKAVESFEPAAEVRAIVEGQFLAMCSHSERIGMPCPPLRVVATGGASINQALLDVAASVFGCDVFIAKRPDSASLGAALRAAHGWLCNKDISKFISFARVLSHAKAGSAVTLDKAAASKPEVHEMYMRLLHIRNKIEVDLLKQA